MSLSRIALALLAAFAVTSPLSAQADRADSLRTAQNIDATGKHAEARAIFQKLIDNAPDAATKATAQRRLAMSYGYDGNCAKVLKLEKQVIAYWVTRRAAEPQNAHFQEGEIANEAARVCIDHGFINEAEKMYRLGSKLANAEPAPRTHAKILWDFRLAHALGRVAARRNKATEANRWVTEARRLLDSDTTLANAQRQYFPYLAGYVALFTNDLATAETRLNESIKLLPNDPFQLVLLGMTMEKKGDAARARELYQQAYEKSTASTPPAIYSRSFTKKKLGLP